MDQALLASDDKNAVRYALSALVQKISVDVAVKKPTPASAFSNAVHSPGDMFYTPSEGGPKKFPGKRRLILERKDDTVNEGTEKIVTPGDIFAPHELMAYFQLRFIRIRQYRAILLDQLNFFKSIEKKLRIDADLIIPKWNPDIDPMSYVISTVISKEER